ncbi:MAG: beta-ketoacyl-[acyl-carrier-protein] synthase family protein, partial [Acidiferrobacterales bacterium]
AHIAIMTNARGHCQTVTTACTSSAQAIGEAYRQIKHGITDVVVAGGSDAMINPYGLVAFSTLGVMSTNNDEWRTAARPFDLRRDGFMLGEGAAVVILEEEQHCRRRGAQPYAEVIGYASTSDAYRLTDEPPDAWGSIQAMTAAIEDAAIDPSLITYINAHGTGTKMNDRTETHAIRTVLGENAYGVPVSSTKSMIGHLVAAGGGIEFVTCVLALKYQTVPPTINYEEPDDACDLDYVPNEAREMPQNVILSNSFGFGGQNACLLIRNPT